MSDSGDLLLSRSSEQALQPQNRQFQGAPLTYTNSIDYRSDLQIERDQNLQLQLQLNRLKQANVRQRLELDKLAPISRENEAMRYALAKGREDIANLQGEVDRHAQAYEQSGQLHSKVLELESQLNIFERKNSHLSLQMAALESQNEALRREKQFYLELHVRDEQKLASLEKFEIDAKRRLQQLQLEFEQVNFVCGYIPTGTQPKNNGDYKQILNHFIRVNQDLECQVHQLSSIHQELLDKYHSNEARVEALSHELHAARNAVQDYEELKRRLVMLEQSQLEWKTSLEETMNLKLTEEVEKLSKWYRSNTEKKNSQLLVLVEMLELKKEAMNPDQRGVLEDIMKDFRFR